MNTSQFIRRMGLVASLALTPWIAPLSTYAMDQPAGGSAPSASAEGLGEAASGAVEDTLKACLARIPKDATGGQRMIAEESCNRDEGTRELIQAVPSV